MTHREIRASSMLGTALISEDVSGGLTPCRRVGMGMTWITWHKVLLKYSSFNIYDISYIKAIHCSMLQRAMTHGAGEPTSWTKGGQNTDNTSEGNRVIYCKNSPDNRGHIEVYKVTKNRCCACALLLYLRVWRSSRINSVEVSFAWIWENLTTHQN